MINKIDIDAAVVGIANTLKIRHPSPIQKLSESIFSHSDMWVKRDDLLHPIISGNKWRKLQITLAKAILSGSKRVLSFGGGYSNHLHALSYACSKLDLHCTCLVRGNYQDNPTPTITDIQKWGSDIVYVPKVEYAQKQDASFIERISRQYAPQVIVPEGGSNTDGMHGVASLFKEIKTQHLPDIIVLPVGSAGTIAGLIKSIYQHKCTTQVIGISVLKAGNSHEEAVETLFPMANQVKNWKILTDFHHGGYAKSSTQLIDFKKIIEPELGFALDPIYNTKSFYAINELMSNDEAMQHASICVIQTGGNQGARS
ncbi:MAG: pyridoxal-phosphate dependent enzyme [Pseudomonadota bacterium]